MEKTRLKDFLQNTPIGTEFQLTTTGELAHLTGSYKLLEVARGRGKCGSKIAKIMSMADGTVISDVVVDRRKKAFGTPVSEFILHIKCGETNYGTESKAEDTNFPLPRNEEIANALKAEFLKYTEEESINVRMRIKSSEPWLNGEWTCTKVEKNPGRQGQLTLTLKGAASEIKLWTYRHSGAIEDMELLEA